jgi:hypothetical protein
VTAVLDALAEIPNGAVLGVIALAVLLVQLGVLLVAWTRSASEAWLSRLHALSGATILALPISAVAIVHQSRSLILEAIASSDPSGKATAVSRGISGQLNAIPFFVVVLGAAVILWFIGLWPTFGKAGSGSRRNLVLFGLFAIGLDAVAAGAVLWSAAVIHRFASLAGVDPDEKVVQLDGALTLARKSFEAFAGASRWTLVGLTIGCSIAAALSRGAPAEGRRLRRERAVALVALVLAAALFVVSRPMRAENATPWPPPARGDLLAEAEPRTPQIDGPDEVRRAPVVQIFDDKLALDGYETDLEGLAEKLATLRRNYALLQPDGRFEGLSVLVVSETAPMARVRAVLHVLHEGGYERPLFAFAREEVADRPTFGRLKRVLGSGARATLIDAYDVDAAKDPKGGAQGTLVHAAELRSYDALARRVVALRASGAPVVLDLGK